MKRAILLLISVFSALTATADICFKTFEQDTAEADIIFVGRVVEIDIDAFWHRGDPQEIFTFEIQESFKGISKYREVISILGPAYGCCNVHFKKDSTYLVFAYGDGEHSRTYWTNDCSLSGLLTDTKEFYEKLGDPVIPTGNGWAKKFFSKKKALEDSVSKAHANLLNNYASEQRKATFLTYAVIGLSLILLLLLIGRIRIKST